jgi:branched-chain amino acid transport system substrate-binding protein
MIRLALASLLLVLSGAAAGAQMSDGVIRIGVLADMASVYSDISGPGSVVAAELAVEDFAGAIDGAPIEILAADHQNKPDIASVKSREWYESGRVDLIASAATSSTGLAIQEVARQLHRVVIHAGPGTSRLTNEACSPVGVHWAYDTHALAVGVALPIVREGGDSWFFLAVDYSYGDQMVADATQIIEAQGGRVVGAIRHPFPTADFSSYLLQAQASGAKVIGLANAGQDTINAIKQAREFGIAEGGQKLAGLLVFLSDVEAIGLETAAGILLTTPFYWDYDAATRAFARRFAERTGKPPTMNQAAVYSAVRHYLRAVEAAGGDGPDVVMAKMRALPIDDFFARNGYIREDGRAVNDMFLARVKTPEESTGHWDFYEIIGVIPGDEAFRPLAQSACPLIQ